MRKEYVILIFIVACIFSCQGKKDNTSIVENDSIACNILGVNLNDNPYIIKEKLTKEGYHWKENVFKNGFCTIRIEENFSFSGHDFGDLSFHTMDTKLYLIQFGRECDSLSSAQKLYDEVSKKILAKYSKFKDLKVKQYDNCVKSLEFDDGKIHLLIGIFHHEKDEILASFDEEEKHRAREYWSVSISYLPQKEVEDKDKNDF